MTGGTDFCGLYNRYPVSVGDIDVPDDAVTKLLGYKAKIRRMQKKAQKPLRKPQSQINLRKAAFKRQGLLWTTAM